MPKVSICIPTYNQTIHLKKCIDSVLMQNYQDYEIIISDDSTTDDVKNYFETLDNKQKINYYRNKISLGTPKNWNQSIKYAKGEFIKILHHDDFFTQKDSLFTFINLFENKPNVNFAFCSTLVWSINENKKWNHICSKKNMDRLINEPEFLFFNNVIGAPSATLFRNNTRHLFDENFKWLVDVDFYIQQLKQNNNILYCNTPLICTINGAVGQVTQSVINDITIQVKEHVLLFEKVTSKTNIKKLYLKYFNELFLSCNIQNIAELKNYVEVNTDLLPFFNTVFNNLNKYKLLKKIKYKLLNSSLNRNYIKI